MSTFLNRSIINDHTEEQDQLTKTKEKIVIIIPNNGHRLQKEPRLGAGEDILVYMGLLYSRKYRNVIISSELRPVEKESKNLELETEIQNSIHSFHTDLGEDRNSSLEGKP